MASLPPLEKPLIDKPESSYTLPADYYLSAQIFELEKERIFYRSWQYVGHQSMLPAAGDYITLKICDENIFVIRSSDGELRAFYNVCRHRAHELLEGSGSVRNLVVCPYHAWSYSDSGELVQAPMSQYRADFDKAEFCLRPVRLELFCGCIFVNLEPNCASLNSIAGDLAKDIHAHLPYLDELRPAMLDEQPGSLIDAGWKVVVDNYVECYHCRPAHPDFASIIDMDSYQTDVFAFWSRQYGPDTRSDNSAYPFDPETGFQRAVFWYLWPNTTFNVMPGPEGLGVFAVRPIDAGRCDFAGDSLAIGGESYAPRARYVNEILGPEDIRICESVQRGLCSRSYDQGIYMVDPARPGESEQALHHFHRLVLESLSED